MKRYAAAVSLVLAMAMAGCDTGERAAVETVHGPRTAEAAGMPDADAAPAPGEQPAAAAKPEPAPAPRTGRPNVILMMADDLGYADLSCYGSEKIKTPVLDRLAAGGVRLTSFYAGCTVCTPSRMSLLTGMYPWRVGWRKGVIGYPMKGDEGLSPRALTIAEVFKAAGYRTALYGKWHIGDTPPLQPNAQGFADAYYILRSNNQCEEYYHNGAVDGTFDNARLTETFAERAVAFIRKHRDRPFFLYLPFTAPHFPAEPHPDWKGRSENGPYGDVVEELDARIGAILQTLEETNLADNTIVVFLSDNGPESNQKQWSRSTPFRGRKWSAMEGGYRVPCIVRLPRAVPAGRETGAMISAMDLLPTLAHACDIDLASQQTGIVELDGYDVWDTLTGAEDAEHPRTELLYWHGWGKLEAIRVGEWKLFLTRDHLGIEGTGPALFNLAKDPAERNDFSAQHPDRVGEMSARAEGLLYAIEEATIELGVQPG